MKAELINCRTTIDFTYSIERENTIYTAYVTISDDADISFDIVDEDGNEPDDLVWDEICDFIESEIDKQAQPNNN